MIVGVIAVTALKSFPAYTGHANERDYNILKGKGLG